tara:strand:+ start:2870 stop:3973 length:1104 start_codon:yes stop_codon:yes gene_type:complete
MSDKKVFIHINLPRDVLRKAAAKENFKETALKYSSYVSGLVDGFKKNKIEPIVSFRMHYFFNWRILYKSKYYKYFFILYNFFFGIVDNFFLYRNILKELKEKKIEFYFTELNPTITKLFLKKLNENNIKSIEWFGLFPNQLGFNTRPNKTIEDFDLIVSGEDYTSFFNSKPKKFLLVPQAIPIDKINKIIDYKEEDKIDLLFVGSVSKIHSNRWEYLEYLCDNYSSIGLYGFGLDQVPNNFSFKKKFKGSLWGNQYYKKLKEAKIVINLFQDDYESLSDGINIRALEIPACKSLQICKRIPSLISYFKEDYDIVLFSDKKEMKSKIDYYLDNKNERERIINNGVLKVKKYDFSNQLRQILNIFKVQV